MTRLIIYNFIVCYYHASIWPFEMRTSFQDTNKQLKYFHSEHLSCGVLRVNAAVFNVASQNVFCEVHVHSTYALIKFATDLWYHDVLILCEYVVSNTFLRNIFLVKPFLISIIQRVLPVSLT